MPSTIDPALVSAVLGDIQQGELPIPLGELRSQPWMPRRNGRQQDRSVAFRWHQRGTSNVRLGAVRTPAGLVTTRSAVMRFFAALSTTNVITTATSATVPSSRSPARRARDVDGARRRLQEAGL